MSAMSGVESRCAPSQSKRKSMGISQKVQGDEMRADQIKIHDMIYNKLKNNWSLNSSQNRKEKSQKKQKSMCLPNLPIASVRNTQQLTNNLKQSQQINQQYSSQVHKNISHGQINQLPSFSQKNQNLDLKANQTLKINNTQTNFTAAESNKNSQSRQQNSVSSSNDISSIVGTTKNSAVSPFMIIEEPPQKIKKPRGADRSQTFRSGKRSSIITLERLKATAGSQLGFQKQIAQPQAVISSTRTRIQQNNSQNLNLPMVITQQTQKTKLEYEIINATFGQRVRKQKSSDLVNNQTDLMNNINEVEIRRKANMSEPNVLKSEMRNDHKWQYYSVFNSPPHDIFFTKQRDYNPQQFSDQRLEDVQLEFQSRLQWHYSSRIMPCDRNYINDPQQVAEFTHEIMNYFLKNESKTTIRSNYMGRQNQITERMRAILIDWIIQVLFQFKCKSESLFLSINLVDRYLEKILVSKETLQLVGVAAMLIACKYEEIWPPLINDFIYMCDKAFDKEQIVQMEIHMLQTLDFSIETVSANSVLERLYQIENINLSKQTQDLAQYLVELALFNYQTITTQPSYLAMSALYLACKLVRHPCPIPKSLTIIQVYTEEQLYNLAQILYSQLKAYSDPNYSLSGLKKKFSTEQFSKVSSLFILESGRSEQNIQQQINPKIESTNEKHFQNDPASLTNNMQVSQAKTRASQGNLATSTDKKSIEISTGHRQSSSLRGGGNFASQISLSSTKNVSNTKVNTRVITSQQMSQFLNNSKQKLIKHPKPSKGLENQAQILQFLKKNESGCQLKN